MELILVTIAVNVWVGAQGHEALINLVDGVFGNLEVKYAVQVITTHLHVQN